MKQIRLLLLTISLLALLAVGVSATTVGVSVRDPNSGNYETQTATVVNLVRDGTPLTSDVPAFLLGGRTMVPVRVVSEDLGADVTWDQAAQQVHITRNETKIVLTIGSAVALVNEQETTLYDGVAPVLVKIGGVSRTMVPLRFVSDQLGAEIQWDSATYTAAITTNQELFSTIGQPRLTDQVVSVSISGDCKPQVFALSGRVVVDFPGGMFDGNSSGSLQVGGVAIASARYNQYDLEYPGHSRVARMVLDLQEGYSLSDLTVDITETAVTITQPDGVPPVVTPDEPSPPLVVLDAGHGGKDTGAIYFGWDEKAINLPVTLQVGALLEQAGYQVAYTRQEDQAVSLQERTDYANALKADIFVSIHANAFPQNPAVNGLETYYLTGGTTAKTLASAIQTAVLAATGANDRGIRQANFYVLKYTTMPAVLVETGYMSNEAECQNLTSPEYQAQLAQGIANGVMAYLGPVFPS